MKRPGVQSGWTLKEVTKNSALFSILQVGVFFICPQNQKVSEGRKGSMYFYLNNFCWGQKKKFVFNENATFPKGPQCTELLTEGMTWHISGENSCGCESELFTQTARGSDSVSIRLTGADCFRVPQNENNARLR